MNSKQEYMDELLVKYLAGEIGATEQQELDQWLQADEANRHYMAHFRMIWEQSKTLAQNSAADENAAWQRFRQRVAVTENTSVRRIKLHYRPYLQAAALVLLISTGIFLFMNRQSPMQTITASATPLTATLPDGSVITLNARASLSYPETFRGHQREVILKGEAFFNISPDKSKPFIIDANGIGIKVVGTSFNVKSDSARTEVIVETGIVEVSSAAHAIMLHPHEKTTVLKDGRSLIKEQSEDALYNYYRTHEFVCNNTPLWRLTEILNEAFHVQILIRDPAKRNLPLTTTFKQEQLDNILSVICTTFELQAVRNGDQIILE